MTRQKPNKPKRGFRWSSLFVLPIILLLLLLAFTAFFQPVVLEVVHFEQWASRPWLLRPVAIVTALLSLVALYWLPWRHASAKARFGLFPTALIVSGATLVGITGATLSYGLTPWHFFRLQQSVVTIQAGVIKLRTLPFLHYTSCMDDAFDNPEKHVSVVGLTASTYERLVVDQCACPIKDDVYADAGDGFRWASSDAPLAFEWHGTDCLSATLLLQPISSGTCIYTVSRLASMSTRYFTIGAERLDAVRDLHKISDFCRRSDGSQTMIMTFQIQAVL